MNSDLKNDFVTDQCKAIEAFLDQVEEKNAEYKAAVQGYVNLLGWIEAIPDDQKPSG